MYASQVSLSNFFSFRLLLDNPQAEFSFDAPRGYQESTILAAVVTKDELEPKASKCTKVTLEYVHFFPNLLVFSLRDTFSHANSRFTCGTLVLKTQNWTTLKEKFQA